MNRTPYNLKDLSDTQLLASLASVVGKTNVLTAELLAHLAEVDARRLYVVQGHSSLHCYCTERLGFSDDEAAKRIHAARAARHYPAIFALVADGELCLTSVNLVAPYLQPHNADELLTMARRKSKRELLELLAARFPQPDVATSLRQLPAPRLARVGQAQPALPCAVAHAATLAAAAGMVAVGTASVTAAPAPAPVLRMSASAAPASVSASVPRVSASVSAPMPSTACAQPALASAVLAPLSAERFKLQVTLSRQGRDALLRAQALLGRQVAPQDLAAVIERALGDLCEHLERQKFGTCKKKTRASTELQQQQQQQQQQQSPPQQQQQQVQQQPNINDGMVVRSAPASGEHAPEPVNNETGDLRPQPQQGQHQQPATLPSSVSSSRAVEAASTPMATPSRSRAIPRSVRREVAQRDNCWCAYVSPDGHRCTQTTQLEFHHRQPYARGGLSTVAGLELRCRCHNDMQARLDFGEAHMATVKRCRLGYATT